MAKISLKKMETKLNSLTNQLTKTRERQNNCVNKQFELENNDLSHTRAYEKQIELDFELASKIEDKQKEINNIKQRIRRKKQ